MQSHPARVVFSFTIGQIWRIVKQKTELNKITIIPGDIENTMRIKNDCTYSEYKDNALGAFHQYEHFGATSEQVTNYLAEDDWRGEGLKGTSAFLWYLSVATREVELDCLEERVLCEISFHIPLYEQGEYHDLADDEKELVDKDIAYIKSKVLLIPKEQLKAVD